MVKAFLNYDFKILKLKEKIKINEIKFNTFFSWKKVHKVRCQWLTPVTLTTWEAEIGRIMV
jgi:hypothetical protein